MLTTDLIALVIVICIAGFTVFAVIGRDASNIMIGSGVCILFYLLYSACLFSLGVEFESSTLALMLLAPVGAIVAGGIVGWNTDGLILWAKDLRKRKHPSCYYQTKNGFSTGVMRDKDRRFFEGRLAQILPETFSDGSIYIKYVLLTRFGDIRLESVDKEYFTNDQLFMQIWLIVEKGLKKTGAYTIVEAGVDENDRQVNYLNLAKRRLV